MISKLFWKLNQGRLRLLGLMLKPRSIINPYKNKRVKVHTLTINGVQYNIVEARNSRLFTNKTNNITLIVEGGIEPLTSWHCVGWDNLPPAKNKLLTGELLINHFPKAIHATVAVLLCGQAGHYNYFHWLYDVLPRLLLIEKVVASDEKVKYLIPQIALPFQRESLALLGIDIADAITSTEHNFIQADKLITTTHPIHTSWEPPGWTIDFVRSRFLPTGSGVKVGPRIYISRGDSNNGRVLLNEARLIALLDKLGFKSLNLSNLSLADQIAVFSQAKVVIGVHGAGFTNITFCQPGTTIFEIACQEYPNMIFETISKHLNLNHHYIFCDVPNPEGQPMSYNLHMAEDTIEHLRMELENI